MRETSGVRGREKDTGQGVSIGHLQTCLQCDAVKEEAGNLEVVGDHFGGRGIRVIFVRQASGSQLEFPRVVMPMSPAMEHQTRLQADLQMPLGSRLSLPWFGGIQPKLLPDTPPEMGVGHCPSESGAVVVRHHGIFQIPHLTQNNEGRFGS